MFILRQSEDHIVTHADFHMLLLDMKAYPCFRILSPHIAIITHLWLYLLSEDLVTVIRSKSGTVCVIWLISFIIKFTWFNVWTRALLVLFVFSLLCMFNLNVKLSITCINIWYCVFTLLHYTSYRLYLNHLRAVDVWFLLEVWWKKYKRHFCLS